MLEGHNRAIRSLAVFAAIYLLTGPMKLGALLLLIAWHSIDPGWCQRVHREAPQIT
jgi:hypothetical protein